jgi:hypothetical protein
VFYVNLPVGLLSLFFIWRFFPHIRHVASTIKIRLDWPGAVLIAVALGGAQLAVEELPKHGLSPMLAGLLVLSLASFYGLWKWEQRASQPLLPMEVWRDPSLAPLFILAICVGFAMFSMLFYAPLLFQGGFGMSPQAAGLLITPLVACITVASIVNGRLVTRVRNPNLMLYVGFVLIALASLGMALTERTSSNAFMVTTMLIGGLGFGLVLPNLTIFAQQTAPRAHLGIATALLQSLRMMYADGVQRTLELENGQQWLGTFHNPEILMDAASQQKLLAQTVQSGHDGAAMLTAAREALVGAIHMGVALAIVMSLIGLWMTRRVPPVSFSRPLAPPEIVD